MEYLKIAQDLEMYGVSYFAITVRRNNCNTLWYFSVAAMLIQMSAFCFTLPAK